MCLDDAEEDLRHGVDRVRYALAERSHAKIAKTGEIDTSERNRSPPRTR